MKILSFKSILIFSILLSVNFLQAQVVIEGGGDGGGEVTCDKLSEGAVDHVLVSGETGSILELLGGTQAGWNNQIRFWDQCKERNLQHVIAANNTSGRLIIAPGYYGSTQSDVMEVHGRIAIGTQNTPTILHGDIPLNDYKLFVNGGILSNEIRVAVGWADYVFLDDYTLLPLGDVKSYINEFGRLPRMPSTAEVEDSGLALGEITVKQQEKIEEIYLHLIQLEERIAELEAENKELRQALDEEE